MNIINLKIRKYMDGFFVSYDTEYTKNMVKDEYMTKDEIVNLIVVGL